MSADLLFEIGTEEIPAGFLARAMVDLTRMASEALTAARLTHDGVRVLGTPRRLVLLVTALADRQPDLAERVVGPPVGAAFDKAGAPTKAASGFAERNGVPVTALERTTVEGKKGEYVVCTRKEVGRAAAEVLPSLLDGLLRSLPWPKSMRWGAGAESFVRPVHWLVALLGETVLPVSFAGIDSGRHTRGHRFLAPAPIELASPAVYVESLRQAFVIVDPAIRRELIVAELSRIERETGAQIRPDEALLDEVANLVEYPVAICGEFDAAYLEVPEEVIVSAMRAHQRFFAMNAADGTLANRFITIAGTVTRDADVVRRGNERVLAARLADARFFFREDQKKPLATLRARLDEVVFQAKLGTIGAKVARTEALAAKVAAQVGADAAACVRAAGLAKADLVSAMVGEFPELQGVMGAHYARMQGESTEVATAIAEHYLPRGAGATLPTGAIGAVVGLADRIDTLVGCFAVGLSPTGSADPYGLRRAALAILAVLADRGWRVSLVDLIDWAAAGYGDSIKVTAEHKAALAEFFRTRLRGYMIDTLGLPQDCVDAALTAGSSDVPDARARAVAVAELRQRADFEPLAAAFKRIANILKGAAAEAAPDAARFTETAERELWASFTKVRDAVAQNLSGGDYASSLSLLAELKAPVDRFFDAVMVMDEDPAVRANRLALLGTINATFTRIADFRQLAVAT